jgi:hypothetical protein
VKNCCEDLIELVALAVTVFTLTVGWSHHFNRTASRAPATTFINAHPTLTLQ